MYKVFFNEREILLSDDFSKIFQVKYGLFYKYREEEDLKELLEFYRNLKRIDSLYIFHNDMEELRSAFRSCFTVLEAAGGLVINTKGQVLVMHRRGKWDLPKGKLDLHESFEEAALREVSEECGIHDLSITSELIATYHSYLIDQNPVLKKTKWFEMSYTGKEEPVPQQNEDITEVRWVDPAQVGFILKDSYKTIRDVLLYKGLLRS